MSICNNQHLLSNESGSSNGLTDRDILAETGRARALPRSIRLKKRHERKKIRGPCAVTAAFVAGCQRAAKSGLAHHEAGAMSVFFGESVKLKARGWGGRDGRV